MLAQCRMRAARLLRAHRTRNAHAPQKTYLYIMAAASYFADQTYENQDFTEVSWAAGEYEGCTFVGCNLERVDWSGSQFADCTFRDCNASLAILHRTSFQDVQFERCKLLGLRWEHVNPIGLALSFRNCTLDHTSWYQMRLKKTRFDGSSLVEADFTEADLTEAVFLDTNLTRATFDHAVLERADLRTADGFSIDPQRNKLTGARFTLSGLPGLLDAHQLRIEP
jgi:uncharacterized protein YjbI with pentapeptide repeats